MRLSHRIIAILIVCWIPFCCCSIKAAAAMASGQTSGDAPRMSCCGGTHGACSATDEGDSDKQPAEGGDCAGCCDRFAPEGFEQESVPPIDQIGVDRMVPPTTLEHGVDPELGFFQCTEGHPPDPPPASLVNLACQLQV